MIENVYVIAINITEIKDVTYSFIQYVVLYNGPEAYMYETKLCLCYVMENIFVLIYPLFMEYVCLTE